MDEKANDDNKQIDEEENDEDCTSEEYEEDPAPDPTVLEWSSFCYEANSEWARAERWKCMEMSRVALGIRPVPFFENYYSKEYVDKCYKHLQDFYLLGLNKFYPRRMVHGSLRLFNAHIDNFNKSNLYAAYQDPRLLDEGLSALAQNSIPMGFRDRSNHLESPSDKNHCTKRAKYSSADA